MADNDHDPAAPSAAPQPGRARTWFDRWKPLGVWLTLIALALEGVVLAVLVVVGLVDLLVGSDRVVSVAVALVVCAALGSWLLLACAVGLGTGRPWVRGPSITLQLLAVLVGISLLQGGVPVLGGVLTAVGGVTLVGLLSPPVSRYTGRTTFSFHQD